MYINTYGYQLLFYAFCAGMFFGVILGSFTLIMLRAYENRQQEGD
jgi:hypothetical protein